MSQEDRNGVMLLLLIVGFMTAVACMGSPSAGELRSEIWSPTEAPRADVDCWRSGHSVVCLPKEKP